MTRGHSKPVPKLIVHMFYASKTMIDDLLLLYKLFTLLLLFFTWINGVIDISGVGGGDGGERGEAEQDLQHVH